MRTVLGTEKRTVARLALFTALALLSIHDTASAFDCGKARTPIETAICADTAAKASDEAMVSAFERLRGSAAPDQRQTILDDQRSWLKERNAGCGSENIATCIADSNRKRTAMLLAQPESGPGLEALLVPTFVRQAGSKTKVAVAGQVYRFVEPRSVGERLVNAEADKSLAALTRMKDEPDDRDWSSEVSWTLAFASPTFLSIRTVSFDYSGGAHGSTSTGALNIDMKAGRTLTFADLFDARAKAEIGKSCLKQIVSEKKERGAGEDDQTELPKQITEGVGDLSHWEFSDSTATIHFDHYALGSYAEGPYECALPLKQINALSKLPLPLR